MNKVKVSLETNNHNLPTHMKSSEHVQNLESYSSRLGFTILKKTHSSAGSTSIIRIDSVTDLEDLLRRQKIHLLPVKRSQIILKLPLLQSEDKAHWAKLLTKHYNQCGCVHGVAFLLVGSTILLLHFIFYGVQTTIIWYLPISPLLLFSFTAIGKILGILWSRIQFRRIVRNILDLIHNKSIEVTKG